MKTNQFRIKKITGILLIAVLIFSLSSCNQMFSVRGEGDISTESRKVYDYKGISSSQGIDVYLTQSDNESVRVETYDNLQDIIITEVKNGVLKIYGDKNFRARVSPKVYVSIKTIEKIKASSASDVYCKGTIKAENISIKLSSASNLDLELEADEVTCNLSSAADMKLYLTADKLDCDLSSSANANVAGKVSELRIEGSSSADFKGFKLSAQDCKVSVSSAADAEVNVSKKLIANASSGADVEYKGNPSITDVNSSSGGDISAK